VEEVTVMLTKRLQAAMEQAAELPAETQDALAEVFEQAVELTRRQPSPPTLAPELRLAFERALVEHAATLEYLKDR
jgi:hypothetical protein